MHFVEPPEKVLTHCGHMCTSRTRGTGPGRLGAAEAKHSPGTLDALRGARVAERAGRADGHARDVVRRCQRSGRTRLTSRRGSHTNRRIERSPRTRSARKQSWSGTVLTHRAHDRCKGIAERPHGAQPGQRIQHRVGSRTVKPARTRRRHDRSSRAKGAGTAGRTAGAADGAVRVDGAARYTCAAQTTNREQSPNTHDINNEEKPFCRKTWTFHCRCSIKHMRP
jgi:hypothetical protein